MTIIDHLGVNRSNTLMYNRNINTYELNHPLTGSAQFEFDRERVEVFMFSDGSVAEFRFNPAVVQVPPQDVSCAFNGQSIASGTSVTAYQSASVASGGTCSSQQRTCINGTLSGTYTFASCTVGTASSCTFNGQAVANGAKVTAYQAVSVPFGGTCSSQQRTCSNGTLSGTYTFASCSVAAAAVCKFNGQDVANGASVTAYQTASVAFGGTCSSQERTCSNGTLLDHILLHHALRDPHHREKLEM
jgi:hypothetical protein